MRFGGRVWLRISERLVDGFRRATSEKNGRKEQFPGNPENPGNRGNPGNPHFAVTLRDLKALVRGKVAEA